MTAVGPVDRAPSFERLVCLEWEASAESSAANSEWHRALGIGSSFEGDAIEPWHFGLEVGPRSLLRPLEMREELAQKTILWRPVASGRAGGAADQDPELRK